MKEFDLEKELKTLQENGWNISLSNKEKQKIFECIKVSNSPDKNLIFNAFKTNKNNSIIQPDEIKILIIGQDPYPDNEKAHGMAFSFKNNAQATDSLKNIFINLGFDIKTTKTNLSKWKDNGVLLLNTALTYENQNTLKEHTAAWKPFVNIIIKNLLDNKQKTDNKLVIMLWGSIANKLSPLTLAKQHTQLFKLNNIKILRASHPSNKYQACNKDIFKNNKYNIKVNAFNNTNHFKECNEFLGKDAINWQNL